EIEVCVPASRFEAAELALNSAACFERLPPSTPNLYNKYKKGFPRFLHTAGYQTPVVLLSDPGIDFRIFKVLGPADHRSKACYSDEVLTYLSIDDIRRCPVPTLPSLIRYLCMVFFRDSDPMSRIRLEQLVDGMSIGRELCHKALSVPEQLQCVLSLVDSKKDRIDDFSGNLVTCYVADQKTADKVARIPGYLAD
ncbi:hypothetical protein RBB50_005432, partial [Rhinocladiella similis]